MNMTYLNMDLCIQYGESKVFDGRNHAQGKCEYSGFAFVKSVTTGL